MAKKQQERRRFEESDRKPWSKEERETYEKMRARLAPIVRDLTTPARAEKKRDPLDVLLGVEPED
jgi:hypothetical protein